MMIRDSIREEWDEAAESFSSFVQEGKDYYREDLNNPATFKLIGNIKGKKVLDLACGEGHNTRILAKKGAVVVGVDFSERMVQLARQVEVKENPGIAYHVSDATNMKILSSNDFDLVTCFMALQDIEHYEKAISEVTRVLRKGGRFVFSIPHPCFGDYIVKDGENITSWKHEEENFVVKQYLGIGRYQVRWDMERIPKPFVTTAFHRTLTDYFYHLRKNGFLVSRLVEPKPTLEAAAKYPSLRKRLKIPQSIVIAAIKLAIPPR